MLSADSSQLSSELNLIEVSLRTNKINSLLAEMSLHDYGTVEIHPDYTIEDARRLYPEPLPEWSGRAIKTPSAIFWWKENDTLKITGIKGWPYPAPENYCLIINPLEFYTQRENLPGSSRVLLRAREESFIYYKAQEYFGYKFPPERPDRRHVDRIILNHESKIPNILLVETKGFLQKNNIGMVTPIGLLPLVKPLSNFKTKNSEGKSVTDGYSILRKTSLGYGIRGHGYIDWNRVAPILIQRKYTFDREGR